MIFNSIIDNLSISQVDDLIFEYELKKKGVDFHYVIDPDDLRDFFFPCGINTRDIKYKQIKEGKIKFDNLSDEQTAYQQLFSFKKAIDKADELVGLDIQFSKRNSCYFILDQHFNELLTMQETYHATKHRTKKNLVNFIELFEDHYNNVSTKTDKINLQKIESEHISVLYAISIGSYNKGIEKLAKLKNDNRLIISNDDLKNADLPEYLIDIFKNNQKSTLHKELYTIFENDVSKIYNFELYNDIQRKNFLNSKKRDFIAIDRVLSINKKLSNGRNNEKENNKILFLLLSKTKLYDAFFQGPYLNKQNPDSFQLLSKLHKIIKNEFALVNDKPFNPHRNVSQLYLKLILEEEDSIEHTIENLKNYKDFILNFNENNSIVLDKKKEYLEELKIYRERFEGSALLKKQFDFIEELNAFKNHNENNKIELKIKEILKEGNKRNFKEKMDDFMTLNFRIFSFYELFKYLFSKVEERKLIIESNFATEEHISHRYHVMPILLNLNNKSNLNVKLYELLNVISDYPPSEKEINTSIKELYESMSSENFFFLKADEDTIFIGRIILLMLIKNKESLEINPSKIIDDHIKRSLNGDTNKSNEYKLNLYYLLVWNLRRSEKYDEAEKFSQKALEINPKDPRFYQSFGLLFYTYYEKAKPDQAHKQDYLIEAIKYFESAKDKLHHLSPSDNMIIRKTRIAILNSLCYCSVLMFVEERNQNSYLDSARKYLNEMKGAMKENMYAHQCFHTEALLEYNEAKYISLKNINKNKNEIIFKLKRAQLEIQKALEYHYCEAYNNLNNNIKDFLKKLNSHPIITDLLDNSLML